MRRDNFRLITNRAPRPVPVWRRISWRHFNWLGVLGVLFSLLVWVALLWITIILWGEQ